MVCSCSYLRHCLAALACWLLLAGAVVVDAQSDTLYCASTALYYLRTPARFVDSGAIVVNFTKPDFNLCHRHCCNTAGCLAYDLSLVANTNGSYTCALHQSVTATVNDTDSRAAFVDLRPSTAQGINGQFLSQKKFTAAVPLVGVSPWSGQLKDCWQLCSGQIGCVGAIATPSNDGYLCQPLAFFTSIETDVRSADWLVLNDRAVPQPTPKNFNYSATPFLAQSPIRGWNSYDSYGGVPSEDVLCANAESVVKYLQPSGYRLISLDWGWWTSLGGDTTLDEYGRFQPSPDRFPSSKDGRGLTSFAEYLHSRGLLLGVYSDAGISIYFNNTGPHHVPVREQCVWSGNTYFLDWLDPRAQAWLDSVVEQWAQWGVDYVKIDCIGSITSWQNVFMYSLAIARSTNPNMILSISPGYNGDVQQERIIANYVNQYRISVDFHDLWDRPQSFYPAIPQMLDYAKQHEQAYAGLPMIAPSSLNLKDNYRLSFTDFDILPLGMIYSYPANGNLTMSAFNHTQQQTCFSIWCIYRSPLLYGGRLEAADIDFDSLSVVTNPHLLYIHSHSYQTVTWWVNHTYLVTHAGSSINQEQFWLIANINATTTFTVTLQSVNGVQCTIIDVWGNQTAIAVTSYAVSLQYSESAVLIIRGCNNQPHPPNFTFTTNLPSELVDNDDNQLGQKVTLARE